MTRFLSSFISKFAIVTAGFSAFASASAMPAPRNIADTLADTGKFQTLTAALKAAGLLEVVARTQGITLFAPNDAAFGRLPTGTVDGLLKNIPALKKILTYHVVAAPFDARQLMLFTGGLRTLNGQNINVRLKQTSVKFGSQIFLSLNESKIVSGKAAANGTINELDAVLLPPQ